MKQHRAAMAYVPIFIFMSDSDDDSENGGIPQYSGPKMTWQEGGHILSFALGRARIEEQFRECFVVWSEGYEASDAAFFAVERVDYTTFGEDWIGYIHGARSRAPYDDFGSRVKRMDAAGSFFSADDQSGVKCKLWLVKEPKDSPTGLHPEFQKIITCYTLSLVSVARR
jgi:hypothetical protein